MRIVFAAALAAAAAASAASAAAYDPIVLQRGWYRVDTYDDGECAGEVRSNGQFYVIFATGFAPGEPAFLTLTNGDMRPIERAVEADGSGQWQDYYIPFRPGRGEGGHVSITLAGRSCVVPLAFDWPRAKGWDEPASHRAR